MGALYVKIRRRSHHLSARPGSPFWSILSGKGGVKLMSLLPSLSGRAYLVVNLQFTG